MESDVKTFRCFQGLFGGYDDITSQQYCNSANFAKDSWSPFTCIVSESNAFLGYFYYPVDFLKSVGNYDSLYSYRSFLLAVFVIFVIFVQYEFFHCK